ncbi:MAG: rimO [Clostridiales bacterium]|jgi:ribosomal protein S12 methylthiotransferase|nr:rimO [Clostridiales bacterium]
MNNCVGMVSLGCDKNRIDSEIMLAILSKNGYNVVNNEKDADVIIINTCGFIDSAKEESIDTIIEMAKNKESGKCKSIIVTGCMAQRYKNELLNELPEIDAIIGTGSYRDICNIVKRSLEGEKSISEFNDINYSLEHENRIITTPGHYAYVKIAEGCNNNCSYCIIPKLRGNFRSRSIENIVSEISELGQKGIREVILVAQDTTMYGIDIYKKKMLSQLLEEIEKIPEIKWIRLMYSYPEEISDELISYMKKSKKLCHYFDIPMQHISNNILRAMGRKSSGENTKALIKKIRSEIPDVIIRTSLIVGFPGESDEDFNELKEFLKEYKLDRVGVFTYSQEEDTIAAIMDKQISSDIKEMRKEILMKLQNSISLENNKKLVGKKMQVMIDGITNEDQFYGRSYGDAPEIDQQVFINKGDNLLNKGDIVNVITTRAYTYDLMGDVEYESSK